MDRPRDPRRALFAAATALAVLIALAAGVPAYYIGPNSAFSAIVALCLVATGVMVGGAGGRGETTAWLIYVALATGQAVACGLILARVLPDRAMIPVWVGSHPGWEHASAHTFLQMVYLAAFLGGRSLQRRYRALSRQIEEAARAAARREALLDEARAEYRRALVAGRRGWLAGASGIGVRSGNSEYGSESGGESGGESHGSGDDASSSVVATRDRGDAPDLAAWLRATGPLARDELRALLDGVAGALEALHGEGGVHLDVRPSAIHRVPRRSGRVGTWRLVDAAVAQLEAARDPGADPASLLSYAAPERLHGAHAGASADIYGLAASIYAAVTGEGPFDPGESALRGAGGSAHPRDPRHLAPVGDDVACVLRIGLATAPADRFGSVAEMRRALLAALDGRLDEAHRAAAARIESRDPWRAAQAPGGTPSPSPIPGPSPTPSPDPIAPLVEHASTDAWHRAYLSMMLAFCAAVTALCVAGGLYLALIADDRDILHFAWACLAGIVAAAWWHWFLVRNRPGATIVWPWVIAAALTVGPALSIGLHSGFVAIVTVLVFAGGMFRGPVRGGSKDRRVLVLAGIWGAHTLAFALIAAGLLGDDGNIPVFARSISLPEAALRHAFVLAVYAAGFAAGRAIDRSHEGLSLEVEAAARDAARGEALLVTAREEIDRVLAAESGGLFSRLRLGGYELGRLLGRGGVGEVYEATHVATGQLVALKLLRRDRAAEAWHARRLRSEAVALRRVRSAHVARIVDGGDLDGDIPFVAMEFIRGTSLAAILRHRASIDAATLGQLVRDVGTGLDDVHRAGVVHLDIKPSNLIRGADATGWQLVDFGTAQLVDTGAPPLVSGTPSYMSPEQARGGALDGRSDLYSFSLVLYRAATGRPAFAIRDPAEVEAAAAAGPPDPRAYAELSADLALVLRIGLAARPDDRFETAAELRDAFTAALDDRLPEPLRRRGAELCAREPWGRVDPMLARRRAASL